MRCLPRSAACMVARRVDRSPASTLFGGFAGTVCWPLSAFMIEHFGWRNACFVYAAIHLLVMLPLQVSVVGAPATIENCSG